MVPLLMKSPTPSAEPIRRRFSLGTADLTALGITAAGLGLRLGSIRDYWNNADEGIYYQIAHAPSAIAGSMIAGNAHPPLYYYLLRATAAVSDDFVWLRVPALVFGTLSIVAIYVLGKRVGGSVCGIAAAIVLALSPGAIELSQLARPYALQFLLLIGATGTLLHYLDQYLGSYPARQPAAQLRNPNRRTLIAYSALMFAAALTHYSSFLVLAGFSIALGFVAITGRLGRRELRDLALAHVPIALAGAVLYAYHVEPTLIDSAMRREALGSWLGAYFVTAPAALWRNFLGVFDFLAGPTLAGVGSIVFLISVAACVQARRFALVAVCLSVVLVAALASAISVYPFGATRHSAYLAPFFALTVGASTAFAFSMGTRVAVGAGVVLALVVVARGPISLAVGVTPREPVEQPEFAITRAEMDGFRGAFERVRTTPGVVFMDLSTTYTLLPLMHDGGIQLEWVVAGDSHQLTWGERQVVVIPQWYMAVGEQNINASNHLWSAIRRARDQQGVSDLLAADVRVVSANGLALPRSIRALSENRAERLSVLDEVSSTSNLSAFRLHVDAYQNQLTRRIRRRSGEPHHTALDSVAGGPVRIQRVSIAH